MMHLSFQLTSVVRIAEQDLLDTNCFYPKNDQFEGVADKLWNSMNCIKSNTVKLLFGWAILATSNRLLFGTFSRVSRLGIRFVGEGEAEVPQLAQRGGY